jgi:hypothetical protein
MKKYLFLKGAFCLFAILAMIMAVGCSKNSTGTGSTGSNTVTFNLTMPETDTGLEGHAVQAYILTQWGDTVAVKSGESTIESGAATVTVTGVANGTFAVLVAVDSANDGFGTDLFQDGDKVWAGLHVAVAANKTIEVGQYYWETYRTSAVVMAIDGVPAGKDGKVIGAAVFDNTVDDLSNLNTQPFFAGDAIVYNNSAVVIMRDQSTNKSAARKAMVPVGDYKLWMIVDCDGTPEQWHQNQGNIPLSNGDLIYHTTFAYEGGTTADLWRDVTASFEALVAYQVTVNFTLPDDASLDGHNAYVCIWSNWGDEVPALVGQGTVSGSTGTVTANVFTPGAYMISVNVDVDGHQYNSGQAPINANDLIWGALNVEIDANKTITIASSAWQHTDQNSVAYGIDGIPAGHDGEVIGGGLFPEGYQPVGHPLIEPISGGWGVIYNNSCIIVMHENNPSQKSFRPATIPDGDYSVWMIIDVDGTPEDWTINGHNPITNGDLVTNYNLTYTGNNSTEFRHTGTFEALQFSTISLNLHLPEGTLQDGRTLAAALWSNVDDTITEAEAYGVVSGQTATLTLDVAEPGTYQLMVGADVDGSGMVINQVQLTRHDLFWGTLDLAIDGDLSITIADSAWQTFSKAVVGIKGIPDGHDGQIICAGAYEQGRPVLSPTERPLYGGTGFVYNNSALLSISGINAGPDSILQTGNYDLWFLLDVDGDYNNYRHGYFYPITVGDGYYKYNFDYTNDPERTQSFTFTTGSFSSFVGIYGTVTCPTYTTGNIYLYTFTKNPLTDTTARSMSQVLLTSPGVYGLPYFANDSCYVAGFWDADASGEDGGPTGPDLLGAYGVAQDGDITAMERVHSSALSSNNIDVELWSPLPTRK